MNDFTKDELQDLKFCVTDHKAYAGDSIHTNLTIKLQSMIDGYCEHTNDVWPAYTISGDIPICGYCYDCNRPVGKVFINE